MSTHQDRNEAKLDPLAAAQVALELGNFKRGGYDEIISIGGSYDGVAAIQEHFSPCLPETYCDFDRKQRGAAQNVDLYGVDLEQNVAVYQVRLAYRWAAKHFMSVKKSYVLVGFNDESGEPFRHPVGAHKIRKAADRFPNDAAAVVRAAQEWMWEITPKQLERALAARQRQGDVLLLKDRLPKDAEALELIDGWYPVGGEEGTHQVYADEVRVKDGRVFALNPKLVHRKNQHCHVFAGEGEGWYSVRLAREAAAWDFAERFGD